ncbi:condensation domain-containing protein [Amycolatopsis sp. PS_44_ISF1]|uniref:condensation domain-containing protein n=1 Tax=Amycolatopsis sp. PS_44_ISF1 TaxID=2974917 RepID=UPI0028E02585|nr:condensation domain-containing protein [Amycolatopsis sp. PS_44_ISF1]MDT8914970.1 condensation domain-containing protein [Amycolatopsis sp. PS_44_ISF1]
MRGGPGGAPPLIVAVHLLLRGRLDVERLRGAVIELVRRHPILRTNYASLGDGEVLAIVHETEGPDVFSVAPSSGLSDENDIHEHVVRTFEDLSRNFLALNRHSILQAVLLPHGENRHSLIFAVDHIAIDERSRVILQRELAALYAGRRDELGEVHSYDPDAIRSTFPRVEETPALRDLLTPLPPRFLASPDPRSGPEAFRTLTAAQPLAPETTARLDAAARRARCTRFVLHLAAAMWALKQFSRSDDIGLVAPIDTRQRAEDFRAVGFYQNLVLLRSRSPRAAGLTETLRECRAIMRETFQRRDHPIAALVAHAAAELGENRYRNPLYQVALIHTAEDSGPGWTLDGLDVRAREIGRSQAAHELRMHVADHPDRTELLLVGAAGAFAQPDLDHLLTLWQRAETALTAPESERAEPA